MLRRFALFLLLLTLCQCQPFSPEIAPPSASAAPSLPSYPSYPTAPAYPAYPAASRQPTVDVPLFPAYPKTSDAFPRNGHPLLGGAVQHRLNLAVGGQTVRLDIVVFDADRYRLRVIDQPDPQASGRAMASLMRAHGAAAGINGGFFTPEFQPIGLMIANGRSTGSFTRTSLIAGAVLQTTHRPRLIWNHEYQGTQGVVNFLQAGPRLVADQRPVSGLDASKKRPRSFIATDGAKTWAIGTSDTCSLATLATLLATTDSLPGLSVQRALNLDGGRSTALWFRTADGQETSAPSWSTVRNYLAIVPN
jgi:uncharacterized protein YigE (DUF2233 family)